MWFLYRFEFCFKISEISVIFLDLIQVFFSFLLFIPFFFKDYDNTILSINVYFYPYNPRNTVSSINKHTQFKKNKNSFSFQDTRMLFLLKHYTIKMDSVRYYLLPNFTILKFYNKKYKYVTVHK